MGLIHAFEPRPPGANMVATSEAKEGRTSMLTCPNCGFANPETAKFCSNCGKPLERQRAVDGERKFATVLFADVARSTAIAEQLDPEDWAVVMNGAFAFMNASVARYGGTVSRLMGDAVLALFGAPIAHEDDAERAVRAGLDIQAAAMDYAADVRQRYGFDFEVRVGINTGTAVLAFVGDQVKTEYTAMGDAANVAARMQSAARLGTVLISADTHRLVHALFDFVPRGPLEVKGKQAPVEAFEVTGAKAIAGNLRGLAGLTSPLVGRDREIDVLTSRLAGLRQGQGAVVALLGEAGLGKSRLIAELRRARETQLDAPVEWFETRAISYGQSIPYYPWRQLGRKIVGGSEGEPAQGTRERLHELVARLGVGADNIPFLETMLSIDTEESRTALSNLSGDTIVSGVAAAVVNVIKAALHRPEGARPHVIVLDDLHWSDMASLELVAQVATLAAFEPLLVICVLRPDRKAASWQLVDRLQASLGSAFARIDLEPLPKEASRELLGNLLHIEDLPESIRAQILERSEGNPFYLEEVLRSLIDDRQVVREGDHWRATRDIIDAKIPETLAGVLSARIDRLPETTKRVAQTAAVIGRVFQHRVLESVCRDAPGMERIEHVEPHIAALSYEQLVRERARDPEREYIFKHALTCDAAYGLLLKSRRRDLHARTGAALEALFADRRDEFAAMLAWHFSEADDPKRALTYSQRAATNAHRLYALPEELVHRERTLACLDQIADAAPAARIDAILEWTTVRHRLANFEGVLERLETAVSLARQSGDKERLAFSLSWTGTMHFVTGFPSRGVPFLMESQQLGAEIGSEKVLLLPLYYGIWSVLDRDPAAAVGQLEEVIGLARKHGVTDILGHATAHRAAAFARIGDYPSARREIQHALDLLPQTVTPMKRADIHIGVGMAYMDMGDYNKGLEYTRIGAQLAEAANGYECACAGYYGVARSQLETQHLDEAKAEFERSMGFASRVGFDSFTTFIRGGAARTEFELGKTIAIDELRAAVESARTANELYGAAQMSEELAGALFRLDRHGEALDTLGTSVAHYRSAGMHPYLARALKLKARLLTATDRGTEAAEALAEAVRIEAAIAERNKSQAMEHA
jgi:class 3 adenylate cyclase/tetratricopeptide (TPR) repeat protein